VQSMDATTAILESGVNESVTVPDAIGVRPGEELDLTVRPEKIVLSADPPESGLCGLRGRVMEVVYLGTSTQYAVRTAEGADLLAFLQNASDSNDVAARGDDVYLTWRPEHSLCLGPAAAPTTIEKAVA
jgi:spermidine/putrescine transport system ATP-binding protein